MESFFSYKGSFYLPLGNTVQLLQYVFQDYNLGFNSSFIEARKKLSQIDKLKRLESYRTMFLNNMNNGSIMLQSTFVYTRITKFMNMS